ncbi:MAG: hypothetical protein JO157_17875 [Acetobacteraceae bacterium]|nr:hypothetical protein [Acetobacteraceae bacterium]
MRVATPVFALSFVLLTFGSANAQIGVEHRDGIQALADRYYTLVDEQTERREHIRERVRARAKVKVEAAMKRRREQRKEEVERRLEGQ